MTFSQSKPGKNISIGKSSENFIEVSGFSSASLVENIVMVSSVEMVQSELFTIWFPRSRTLFTESDQLDTN